MPEGTTAFTEPLNRSIWVNAQRVYGTSRMYAYGKLMASSGRQRAIPEDVAFASDMLVDRVSTNASAYISVLQQLDGEATERYGRAAGVPAGGSIFEPIYRQYLLLPTLPTSSTMLEEDLVWQGMPENVYLVNRIPEDQRSDLDRQVLEAGGYVASYNAAASGGSMVQFSAEKSAKRNEALYLLSQLPEMPYTLDMPGVQVIQIDGKAIGQIVAVVVIGVATLIAGAYGLSMCRDMVSKYFQTKAVENTLAATTTYNDRIHRHNEAVTETNSKLVDYCGQYAMANGTDPARCAELAERLLPYQTPADPGTAAAQIARAMAADDSSSCGFDKCMLYTGTGAAIGLLAGWMAADRMG